jgi:hypothetical protein
MGTLAMYVLTLKWEDMQMQSLTENAADLAQRLRTMSAGRVYEPSELDAAEQLAKNVLKEVSAARRGDFYALGEMTGQWPAFNPRRHGP